MVPCVDGLQWEGEENTWNGQSLLGGVKGNLGKDVTWWPVEKKPHQKKT